MIDIRNIFVCGWQEAIHGMRNSWNSWARSDSTYKNDGSIDILGERDHSLMKRLAGAHPSHAKYRRMIIVYCNITAPLYWWKEFDTYKIGTVSNSQSTMHTIMARGFMPDDFSHEHLLDLGDYDSPIAINVHGEECYYSPKYFITNMLCEMLNFYRDLYLKCADNKEMQKRYWWQIIQLLPSSYNQTRTVMLNYEVLSNIYQNRKDHKLDEWRNFCKWIEGLPYSDLITGTAKESDEG